MKQPPPILLDIMSHGQFVCQIHYTRRGFPIAFDGSPVETHDIRDIEREVYRQRPSLRGRDITIAFSTQKVVTH